jgi:hypothetical protein
MIGWMAAKTHLFCIDLDCPRTLGLGGDRKHYIGYIGIY